MNIQLITEDREVAREKRRILRRQLHRRAEAEYQALEAAYGSLVEGKPVLSLLDAITAGGVDEKGRPRLAIARADRRQVRVDRRHAHVTFDCHSRTWSGSVRGRTSPSLSVELFGVDLPKSHAWETGYAMVPIVPPEIVQQVRGTTNLQYFYTLFEVEAWADRPHLVSPDRDPFLLRDLGHGLYSVIAQWDLTELERTVMTLFRRS